MTKKTPSGAWRSDTIEEIRDGIMAARRPTDPIGVGIDGGIEGAIAFQAQRDGVTVYAGVLDLPTFPDPGSTKKGRQALDLRTIDSWLEWLPAWASVSFERFVAIPAKIGAAMRADSAAKAAKIEAGIEANNTRKSGNDGEIRGLLAAASRRQGFRVLGQRMPQQWRSELGIGQLGGDKERLREAARRMFPLLDHRLSAKSHHNRAESLLLSAHSLVARV